MCKKLKSKLFRDKLKYFGVLNVKKLSVFR